MTFIPETTMSTTGRDVSRRICPHCSKSVSFKTYKAHRRLFYDRSRGVWLSSEEEKEENINEEAPPSSFGEACEQDNGSDMDCAPSQTYYDFCKYSTGIYSQESQFYSGLATQYE